MAFRKTKDEKQQQSFESSPQGLARAAFARGDRYLEVSWPHPVSGVAGDTAGAVVSEGWRLVHAGWVFVEEGHVPRGGGHVGVTGEVVGVYLFERVD